MATYTEGETLRFRNPEKDINPVQIGQSFAIEPNLRPDGYEKPVKGENVQYDQIPFTLVLADKERLSGVVEVHSIGEYYLRDFPDDLQYAIKPAGGDFYDPSTEDDADYGVQESRDRLPLMFLVQFANPPANLRSRIECIMRYGDQEYFCVSAEEYNNDKNQNELIFGSAVDSSDTDRELGDDEVTWILLPPRQDALSELQFIFRERQDQEPTE